MSRTNYAKQMTGLFYYKCRKYQHCLFLINNKTRTVFKRLLLIYNNFFIAINFITVLIKINKS